MPEMVAPRALVFRPLVKGNEDSGNEIARDHVSCAQHPEVTYAFKKLNNSQLFENLNDAYIISMPIFATCK